MRNILLIIQILVSILLIFLITIQAKGSGLGRTFGSSAVSFSRRGLEKLLYKLTFISVGLFILISILSLVF